MNKTQWLLWSISFIEAAKVCLSLGFRPNNFCYYSHKKSWTKPCEFGGQQSSSPVWFPGERPGDLPAGHPADVLQPAPRPFPGDRWAGERAAAGEERPADAAAAPQPAAQHQDEAGARDRDVPTAAGARGGQVRPTSVADSASTFMLYLFLLLTEECRS